MAHTQVLRHAIDAAKAGNPALAKIHLQKAAEAAPDDPAVWLWMAWLSDSPLSMIQCLDNVVDHEQFKEVAESGLVFARTLASFKFDEFGKSDVAAAQTVSVAVAAHASSESAATSVENAVEEAAREIVEAPSIAEALAASAPVNAQVVTADTAVVQTANETESNSEVGVSEPSSESADHPDETSPVDETHESIYDGFDQSHAEDSTKRDDFFDLNRASSQSSSNDESADESQITTEDDVRDEPTNVVDAIVEPVLSGTPANVWRAAQSDWFSLDSDQPAARQAPQVGPQASTDIDKTPVAAISNGEVEARATKESQDVEVLNPEIPSFCPEQTTTVDVQLAEQIQSHQHQEFSQPVDNHGQSNDGPVIAPSIPIAEDSWGSTSGPFVAPEIPSTPSSHPASEETELDPVADFEAFAGQAYDQFDNSESDDSEVVLVVDDSPTVRKLIAMTLEKRGYKVASAFDGVAAIKEIASHNPALILMDVNMPRLDGYQLCKLVKKHNSTRHIPVVLLTGKDGMFDRLRGRLVGCSGYITKPFVPDDLVSTVEQFLAAAKKNKR
jgi:twitching motility two-component system response regulator PilG